MLLLNRIVELQSKSVSHTTTDTQAEYDYIESLVELTKPKLPFNSHHYLIATSFRYPLPVAPEYLARFRPPFYNRNAFYGASHYETAVYESAYRFLRQRVHLVGLSVTPERRTLFRVGFNDPHLTDIKTRDDVKTLMDRNNYTPSHQFVLKNPAISSILYPSCRDPKKRDCVCTFDINTLAKKPRDEKNLQFLYDERSQSCRVEDAIGQKSPLVIEWGVVR